MSEALFVQFGGVTYTYKDAKKKYLLDAREKMTAFSALVGAVTADDVHRECPPWPGLDPRIIGAVMRDERFIPTGRYIKSSREECHSRPIQIFEVAK